MRSACPKAQRAPWVPLAPTVVRATCASTLNPRCNHNHNHSHNQEARWTKCSLPRTHVGVDRFRHLIFARKSIVQRMVVVVRRICHPTRRNEIGTVTRTLPRRSSRTHQALQSCPLHARHARPFYFNISIKSSGARPAMVSRPHVCRYMFAPIARYGSAHWDPPSRPEHRYKCAHHSARPRGLTSRSRCQVGHDCLPSHRPSRALHTPPCHLRNEQRS